jgi:hypothetical protein
MKDGSKQNDGIHLNTYDIKKEEILLLITVLSEKFKLKCSIHKHKSGDRIYIKK